MSDGVTNLRHPTLKKHSDDQPLLVKQSVHLRGLMFHPFGEEIGNDLFHSFFSEP